MTNLLGEPPATLLPDDPDARAELESRHRPDSGRRRPSQLCGAWAELADRALAAGEPVAAYAYARTGYHRSLDQLRRAGWKGHGPVPWEHEPNQGFLRSLNALGLAAAAIGEDEEAVRCADFLRDSSPSAVAALAD